MPAARCVAFVVALLAVLGCGKNTGGRVEVNGEVRFKGQPLKDGILMFEPAEGQDTQAQIPITDGSYSIYRESGLKPGKYLIRITAGDGTTPVNVINPDEGPGPTGPKGGKNTNIISKDLIPEKWNTKSKEYRTVTSDSPNKIDFDIN